CFLDVCTSHFYEFSLIGLRRTPFPTSDTMNAARNAKTPHGFADEKCQKCNVPKIDNVKTCPTCGLDWGAPNVRAASRIEERTALKDRAKAVVRLAKKNQTIDGLERFSDKVQKDSHVVLALPSNLARSC